MAAFHSLPFPTSHLVDTTMFWSPHSGGVRRYLQAKHAWAERYGAWRHTIATPLLDESSKARIPSIPWPGSGGHRMPYHRGMAADVLCKLQPDLIEAGDPYLLAWAALDAAERLKIPAVAFCHFNLEAMALRWSPGRSSALASPLASRLARSYARNLYRRFDLVLAPSEAMRRRLLDWGVDQVVHQPLGVDTSMFRPERRSRAWRQMLGLPAEARLLVYAGRFVPEKNLQVLADAVRRLGEPYWLLAVGTGPAPPHGARVMVMPYVASTARLATVLASADAFVHAGLQEAFGLSALEAMACGLPVVAPAVEGLADLVDARVGVPVAATARAEDFAQAIEALFQTDLALLSRTARERAQALDWHQVLPQFSQQYLRVMQQRSKARPVQAFSFGRFGLR